MRELRLAPSVELDVQTETKDRLCAKYRPIAESARTLSDSRIPPDSVEMCADRLFVGKSMWVHRRIETGHRGRLSPLHTIQRRPGRRARPRRGTVAACPSRGVWENLRNEAASTHRHASSSAALSLRSFLFTSGQRQDWPVPAQRQSARVHHSFSSWRNIPAPGSDPCRRI
ncbi:hypothetical protein BC628DRAFT_762844 [Trametes gibbosa]|nr:hypothetical protein BC628DRAFT_762844 [Trametes gibbosa]